jgi:V-type H+-transporting ATPase subunit a
MTQDTLSSTLNQLLVVVPDCRCSLIEQIRLYVLRERELYIQLNRLRMQASLFIGDLWIPTQHVMDVEHLLHA